MTKRCSLSTTPTTVFFGGVCGYPRSSPIFNDCHLPLPMLTRVLRSRYVFEKDKLGGENVSPANMTVRDAALFGANRDNFQRVR